MTTANTFLGGLVMDSNDLAVPNNVLTNCLNGTLITYNGDELILLNDVGNSKIPDKLFYVQLKKGYTPIGLKEYGGVFYIFSTDDKGHGEIGTFPSPNYDQIDGKLEYTYRPLHNLVRDGQLVEFNSSLLNFDKYHPLTIECVPAYDSSLNLIFTDNKNIPRLVNTRFSVYGENSYSIIDRRGSDDSNLYMEEALEYEISLLKIVNKIVDINFDGVLEGGNLKVGNYVFYFTLADADDNESDFIGLSGLVSCHKGKLMDPFSIDGGVLDENSEKQVTFTLTNIPRLFNRVYVYYSRATSDLNGYEVTEFQKITEYFEIFRSLSTTKSVTITINGSSPTKTLPRTAVNPRLATIDKAKTQCINSNILFYGNITNSNGFILKLENICLDEVEYEDNKLVSGFNIDFDVLELGEVTPTYQLLNGGGYYNTDNIYHYVGYWPEEYYRLGIVFIMENYTLSPVFNIRGNVNNNKYGIILIPDTYNSEIIRTGDYTVKAVGLHITIGEKTLHKLQTECKVRGYFYVRLKRLKNILCQALTIGYDYESKLPMLQVTDLDNIKHHNGEKLYFTETFLQGEDTIGRFQRTFQEELEVCEVVTQGDPSDNYLWCHKIPAVLTPSRLILDSAFVKEGWFDKYERKYSKDVHKCSVNALLCPEYELNQPTYNSIFTGTKLSIRLVALGGFCRDLVHYRHFYASSSLISPWERLFKAKIIGVAEETKLVSCDDEKFYFRSVAGSASDASLYQTIFSDILILTDVGKKKIAGIELNKDANILATPVVRGIWGPYLGMSVYTTEDEEATIDCYSTINIYKDLTRKSVETEILIRKNDKTEYYPISDRVHIETSDITCFRGDCFAVQYTHRMCRNFTDPEFAMADAIAEDRTYLTGMQLYAEEEVRIKDVSGVCFAISKKDVSLIPDSQAHLNRSDVNAVTLGHWVTFPILSSSNLCLRSTDGSHINERAVTGRPRSFYPLSGIDVTPSNKMPESMVFNNGYSKSLGEQYFVTIEDIPAIDSNYSTRIAYSLVADANNTEISNSLRVFEKTHYVTYTKEYGEITKMLSLGSGKILCTFERAICVIGVKEKSIAALSETGLAYITTHHILSDTPVFLSTEFGAQWPDSVINTASGVYGIDTISKKIWHYGTTFECISDLKVLEFLNANINLDAREYTPNIGVKNVKTHYNKRKSDIMFTYYKYVDGNLKAWNLCYNEITKKWTTFYSWIPSYSDNISNTYYSFNALNWTTDTDNYLWQHNKENNWCNWYDEQHPFEFEFVVADHPLVLKIFNTLQIISNKTLPESFHFELVGESYEFKHDKANMYYRLELTKKFFRNIGKNIAYDTRFMETPIKQNSKSYLFPLKCSHVDTLNKVYDSYLTMTSPTHDYLSYSGSEIVKTKNDYKIATHVKAKPIDSYEWVKLGRLDEDRELLIQIRNNCIKNNIEVRENGEYLEKKVEFGRRLGNCKYLEDIWQVQIPPINFVTKNESKWKTQHINIHANPIPEDITLEEIRKAITIYDPSLFDIDFWSSIKLARLRDKVIRIKIRYTGNDLATISGIITAYKESYN